MTINLLQSLATTHMLPTAGCIVPTTSQPTSQSTMRVVSPNFEFDFVVRDLNGQPARFDDAYQLDQLSKRCKALQAAWVAATHSMLDRSSVRVQHNQVDLVPNILQDQLDWSQQACQAWSKLQDMQLSNTPTVELCFSAFPAKLAVLDTIRKNKDDYFKLQAIAKQCGHDLEVMTELVQLYGQLLQHASPELRQVRQLAELAVSKFAPAFQWLPDELRNNAELASLAARQNVAILQYSKLNSDKAFMTSQVKQNGEAFRYAHVSLLNQFDFVELAVQQLSSNIDLAPHYLRCNKQLVKLACCTYMPALKYFLDNLPDLNDQTEVCLHAIYQHESAWLYIPKSVPGLAAERCCRVVSICLTCMSNFLEDICCCCGCDKAYGPNPCEKLGMWIACCFVVAFVWAMLYKTSQM